MEKPENVEVHLKYKGVEKTFSAPLEETWLLMSRFFSEFLPSFEIANKLLLAVDLQQLFKDCEGLVAFSPEGINLLVSKSRLTDNETLLLWLLGVYVGHKLGLIESNAVSKEELQARLGKSGKITSTRLGELVKSDLIMKTKEEKFSITTFGVTQMQKDILQKIRVKANG